MGRKGENGDGGLPGAPGLPGLPGPKGESVYVEVRSYTVILLVFIEFMLSF